MSGIRWWRVEEPEVAAMKHRGRRLVPAMDFVPPAPEAVEGTSLWMEGNSGENELSFQRTLLLAPNLALLQDLAGVPHGDNLVFAAREVGGAGSIDVAAFFRYDNKQVLLLVDCKDAKSRGEGELVKQCSQAFRLAQAALPNIVVPSRIQPEQVKLVLLAGVGTQRLLPKAIAKMPRPGWYRNGEFVEIPVPRVLGYLPVRASGGDWLALQDLPKPLVESVDDLWRAPWALEARKKNNAALAVPAFSASSPFRCLLVKAVDHASALAGGPTWSALAQGVRRLLDDGRVRKTPIPGWRYAGETNDKGFVRLWWERLPGAENGDLDAYVAGQGVDLSTMDT